MSFEVTPKQSNVGQEKMLCVQEERKGAMQML
jgi:hypothetical protein